MSAKMVELPAAAIEHMSENAKERVPDHLGANLPPPAQEPEIRHVTAETGLYFDLDTGTSSANYFAGADVLFERYYESLVSVQYTSAANDISVYSYNTDISAYKQFQVSDATFASGNTGVGVETSIYPDMLLMVMSNEHQYYAIGNIGAAGTSLSFDWVQIV